jgi:hypothetical protein
MSDIHKNSILCQTVSRRSESEDVSRGVSHGKVKRSLRQGRFGGVVGRNDSVEWSGGTVRWSGREKRFDRAIRRNDSVEWCSESTRPGRRALGRDGESETIRTRRALDGVDCRLCRRRELCARPDGTPPPLRFRWNISRAPPPQGVGGGQHRRTEELERFRGGDPGERFSSLRAATFWRADIYSELFHGIRIYNTYRG